MTGRRWAMGITGAAAALAAALWAEASHAGPADHWLELRAANAPPPARRDAAIGHDRARGRVVVFGGQGGGTPRDDTWSFDVAARTWRQLAVGAAAPEARFSMVAGIDEARGRFLIATGQGASGVFYNDVWALDLASETWSRVAALDGPPAVRYGSSGGIAPSAGFDPPDPALALLVSHGFTDMGRFDDTWALRLAGDRWEDVSPGGNRPLRRCLHAAAAIAADRLVLFGGCASGFGPCPLDDAWRLDLAAGPAWTEITTAPGPSARTFPSLASLGETDTLILYGGNPGGTEVWRLDAGSGAWSALTPTGTAPAGRQGASMTWIAPADRSLDGAGCGYLLVFGGSGGGDRNDVWALLPDRLPPPPSLRAVKGAAGTVVLSWIHDPDTTAYEVWRGERGEILPGAPGLLRLAGQPTISGSDARYDDPAPLPPVVYYQVRLAACGS